MTGPQTTPSLDGIDLGPDDTSLIVMLRGSGAVGTETVAVAVHRRFGVFTHVYASLASPRRGESAVHLVHVLEGERVDAAMEWVLATLAARDALVPSGRGMALRRRREPGSIHAVHAAATMRRRGE